METWGEGGVVYWDSGSCFLSVLCPLGVGGLQRVKNLPFGVVECPGPPWLLVMVTEHLPLMSSMPWSLSLDNQCPDWPGGGPHLVAHLLSGDAHRDTLCHIFFGVGGGDGFRTLEDTGLRFVVKGSLVWMTRVDSPKVTVRPTNREIWSVFAGQTDGLQGEALGKTWALPWWYLCSCPQPSWQSRIRMTSRAGLFKVGSTPEIYLVFVLVLVLVARFHMTFGLMEDQCIRSLPHHSVTLCRASAPLQGGLDCPPLGLGFARGSRS